MNRFLILSRAPFVCVLLLASLTAFADGAELRRGVIVDAAAGAAYLGTPTGLSTGRAVAVPARRPAADAMPKTDARWRAGQTLAALEGGRGGPLTLKRWDAVSGAALPDRELSKKAIAALSSADRAAVLASERVGAGGPDDPEYRWSIFSVATGEKLGEMRHDTSAAPFLLWNGTLVFEAPAHGFRTSGGAWIEEALKIRGARLSTGVPLWDRAIRDLRYRGNRPPMAPRKR